MKTKKITAKKGLIKVDVELTVEEERLLLEYALNDLIEKGAVSIIKEKNEEQIYKLIFEAPQGNA